MNARRDERHIVRLIFTWYFRGSELSSAGDFPISNEHQTLEREKEREYESSKGVSRCL